MSTRRRLSIVAALFAAGLGTAVALQRGCVPTGERGDGPDRAGPPALPQRIVTMAPSIVECLFALGAGGRVAGVGDYCFHPPEAKRLPRVGGEFNPSLESLLALQPDLIAVQGQAEKLAAFARRQGIALLRVNMDDLATIRSGLRALGRAVGREPEADRLVANIDLDLATLQSRVAGRPRPRVFLCMGHTPGSLRGLSTAHAGSFLSQVLEIAGGRNALDDITLAYPPVSKEDLLHRAPDVILDLHPGDELSDDARRQLVADWQPMASLPAVRTGRIHVLTEDYLLLPGPRVTLLARRLAEVLHPDAMAGSP